MNLDIRSKVHEETVLFLSIVKWVSLAILIGVVAGTVTAFFLHLLNLGSEFYQTGFSKYIYFIPFSLLISTFLVRKFAPDASGHGTEKVIEAVHKRYGRINLAVVPVKLVATLVTLIGGGSAGKEGPCAQIGAGLASGMADVIRLGNEDRKKLVVCGISAGFSSVFGTPIAGALFAMEVLVLGMMFQEVLLPSLVAGIISCQTTRFLGITHHFEILKLDNAFSAPLLFWAAVAGLGCGFLAFLLIEFIKLVEIAVKKSKLSPYALAIVGGLVVVLVAALISPDYAGLGVETIDRALRGEAVSHGAFGWKSLTTAVTLASGGSGGVLTPVFFIGSTAGSFFGYIFELDLALFASIGLVALLAGATNTPVASSILAIEMFGPAIGPYAAVACVISYIASGHRSLYASQIIGAAKSSSLIAPLMKSAGSVEDVTLRPGAQRAIDDFEAIPEKLNPINWGKKNARKKRKSEKDSGKGKKE